jgi:hypothetical protein
VAYLLHLADQDGILGEENDMPNFSITNNRCGIYYFPDTAHYGNADLALWLPRLIDLDLTWITLLSPLERAIPEPFIRGLTEYGITPIIQFLPELGQRVSLSAIHPILKAYADWGIRYISFYERPNLMRSWGTGAWSQHHLVDRFLDRVTPLYRGLVNYGFSPVFTPLEPGGDYWDTAFLRSALEGLKRRHEDRLLEHLILGAYAQPNGKSWFWGQGGPERWPGSRPYSPLPGEQDHRSFFIFEWYSRIAEAITGQKMQVIILRAGDQIQSGTSKNPEEEQEFFRVLHGLSSSSGLTSEAASIPPELMASCFWLLSAENWSRYRHAAWFQPDGSPTARGTQISQVLCRNTNQESGQERKTLSLSAFPIDQYVYVPPTERSTAIFRLQSVLDDGKITFGSSIIDAALARYVIVPGGNQSIPQCQLDELEKAGCEVITCKDNGIELAQILSAL